MKCEVVQDLLPMYLDELTNPVTNEELEEHLKECTLCGEVCRRMREELEAEKQTIDPDEINPLKKIKKKTALKVRIFGGAAIICMLLMIVLLKFTTGNILWTKMVYEKTYTDRDDDIKAAMEAVKWDFFLNYKGGTLRELSYDPLSNSGFWSAGEDGIEARIIIFGKWKTGMIEDGDLRDCTNTEIDYWSWTVEKKNGKWRVLDSGQG